ncbi:hypothetical protein HYO65_gp017 [Tenacibaculum phage PTm1]|uniref:Uncharacterized protein n=1 Tax=Tenacibaculum phage PTm1 TaxID=2547425 RepID=A0A5S9BYY7_9CAUD|nr:hypothetical protein HYO65_gp017 [Tenacibaculum phage PTm1]BBI90409.1 hypothetical protein [Tenacibaculum phage PTm1]
MRKFSNILKRNSAKRESSQIETISEFKNFAHKQLSENSTYDFDVVEQLLESLLVDNKNDINKSLDGLKVFTESVEQVDEGRREPLELTPKNSLLYLII